MKTNSCSLPTAVVVASLSFAGLASAALVETDLFSPSQTTYDGNILANDLIQNGSAALSGVVTTGSVSSSPGNVAPFNSFTHLTDGIASSKTGVTNDISGDTYFDPASYSTNPSITYSFNTTANPTGFTLTSIRSISGWADSTDFSNQRYSVSIALVGAPATFTLLRDVNYAPFAGNTQTPNSSQVTLTDTTGALASGVSAIKFTFLSNGGVGQVFREIDVVGAATVPEPTSLAVGLVSAVGLFGLRRNRRAQA